VEGEVPRRLWYDPEPTQDSAAKQWRLGSVWRMLGHIVGDVLVEAGEKLLELLGRGLGRLDLWVERKFGRCLSGRMNKLEIQTLFHGNTKDQDQI
jgi:hypothetical protein